MAGVFACPECGEELEVEGLSPGREILCDSCSTLVEVPYFPRGTGSRSSKRQPSPRSPWNSLLLKGAIGFAVIAMLGLLVSRLIVGRVRSDQEKVLAELVESAEKAEGNRRFDVALFQIEAALAQGRSMGLKDSSRLDDLKERRDRIIVREVEDRLANIDTLGPDQAVGEALTLVEKAEKNPALASLAGTIEAKLASLRLLQAEADLATARKAFEADRDVEAFAVAERLYDRAGDLSRSDASRFQAEARSLLEATVGRRGVALPPVVGRFVAGSTEAYTKILDRPRAESLRSKGYLPQPGKSAWSQLWDDKAPFRATVQIVETQEEYYLQSKNRTTRVDGTFELFRGDQLIWKNRVVARTRVPLPDLPALLGGHIATSDRNPETERRLHDDAMKQFVEQATKNLRGSPSRETVLKIR
jgi:hypothetical protein